MKLNFEVYNDRNRNVVLFNHISQVAKYLRERGVEERFPLIRQMFSVTRGDEVETREDYVGNDRHWAVYVTESDLVWRHNA